MIGGVNGFNANANFDFSGAHEEKEAYIMGLLRKIGKMGLDLKV